MEFRQFLFFVDRDLLLDKAGMVVLANQLWNPLRLQEGKHICKLVMDRAWIKLLRITKEGSQAQEIFPLHLIQKSLAAGFLEISQGYAISHSCLSFPVELNLFEKVVYGRTDSQTRVVF